MNLTPLHLTYYLEIDPHWPPYTCHTCHKEGVRVRFPSGDSDTILTCGCPYAKDHNNHVMTGISRFPFVKIQEPAP